MNVKNRRRGVIFSFCLILFGVTSLTACGRSTIYADENNGILKEGIMKEITDSKEMLGVGELTDIVGEYNLTVKMGNFVESDSEYLSYPLDATDKEVYLHRDTIFEIWDVRDGPDKVEYIKASLDDFQIDDIVYVTGYDTTEGFVVSKLDKLLLAEEGPGFTGY